MIDCDAPFVNMVSVPSLQTHCSFCKIQLGSWLCSLSTALLSVPKSSKQQTNVPLSKPCQSANPCQSNVLFKIQHLQWRTDLLTKPVQSKVKA